MKWDEWNIGKNLVTHGVSDSEIEQVFDNPHIAIPHKRYKGRRIILGITDGGRYLFLSVQHIDKNTCRPIHARNMEQQERKFYQRNVKREI